MIPRRRRLGLVVAFLVGIPLIGALGAYLWIRRNAEQRWTAAEARIRILSATFPKENRSRPSSAINEAAKDNQIHFVAAIRGAAPSRKWKVVAFQLIVEKQQGEALNDILAESQDFLDRLHQGARRIASSPTDFPPRWAGDWDSDTITYMTYCSVLRSRQQRERKQILEASETLLDSLQLARFWSISGWEINRYRALGCIEPILDELRDVLQSEALSSEELRRLERELQPLDEAMKSPVPGLEPQLARVGEWLQSEDLKESGVMLFAPYRWRYFLPHELMRAQAFEFADRQVQEMLTHAGKGYPELLRLSRGADEEAGESRNPLIQRLGSLIGPAEVVEVERKAQLRLLRMAASYLSTGEISPLPDPLGSFILHAEAGSRIKFWSVGKDGRDDGGDAGKHCTWWLPGPIPGKAASPESRVRVAAKDLVIEVRRRQ